MKPDGENVNMENKTCRSRKRAGAEDLKRQRLYEVIEEALESLVEKGEMEKRLCPEDGKTYYRLRQRCSDQEITPRACDGAPCPSLP
jgi:hypothetical protein